MMDASISVLPGVGPVRRKALEAAGIATVRDLLAQLPADYRDLDDVRPLGTLRPGDVCAVRVRVAGNVQRHQSGKLTILKARVADESGALSAVWYNQPWLYEGMRPGRAFLLYGKVEFRFGELQLVSPSIETGAGLRAVYKPIAGLSANFVKKIIEAALARTQGQWPDELPVALRTRYGLCERNFALQNAHAPASRQALTLARRRLGFEELLLYQVALWLRRGARAAGVQMPIAQGAQEAFFAALPFAPTGAQRRVLDEALTDMRAAYPMARMVQGDVGCGKTLIAFGAIHAAARCGWQSALMAPTEILAAQHHEGARALLEPLGISCGLLTGSLTAKRRRLAHEAIAAGTWQVVIGTHALITEGVAYRRLGLVVCDEQHRFGVRQRALLSEKGDAPNVLVMSATPIPRSLALILYGDLDLSVVDELPPGRMPVKTHVVPEGKRQGMYDFLRAQIQAGRQAYVVCPLIEESEAMDALPAELIYERLRTEVFPQLRVGLVHGRMKPGDKEEMLAAFRDGGVDILVSTTVIEVGVNVPNASVMVVENAERFGLAQLHQLRGRVGRGANESYCFLMAEPNERLRLLARTSDGFEIARKDLELRGAGELLGFRQSGPMAPGLSALAGDAALLYETHEAARALLKDAQSEQARAVIALAEREFGDRLAQVAMN